MSTKGKIYNESPCIKTKCIKFPTCRHREEIACDDFVEYINEQAQPTFFSVSSIFPNAIAICNDNPVYENGICLGKIGFIKLKYD